MASGIPDEVWARNRAEYERRDAKRQHIRKQIMALLPAETDQTPALSRDDLLGVLLLCKKLRRMGDWTGWREEIETAALVRYLGDSGVSAIVGTPVKQLYAHHPGQWCDE